MLRKKRAGSAIPVSCLLLLNSGSSICRQYHGGTNFGRSSGGPFIATSYDYDAPIDEYGEHLSCCDEPPMSHGWWRAWLLNKLLFSSGGTVSWTSMGVGYLDVHLPICGS
jgi:hypothetical protein